MTSLEQDRALIASLGGPARVAELLKCDSVQRVHNWLSRGIPPSVKLERPDLFLPQFTVQESKPAPKHRQQKVGA